MAKPCLSEATHWWFSGSPSGVAPILIPRILSRSAGGSEWHFCSVAPRRGRWKAVLELKPALLLLFRTFTNLMWPIGKKAEKSQLSIELNRITLKRKSKFRDNMTMYCPWNITNRDKTKLTMVSTCWLKNYQESQRSYQGWSTETLMTATQRRGEGTPVRRSMPAVGSQTLSTTPIRRRWEQVKWIWTVANW